MGWFDAEADVERAQRDVNSAQRDVNAAKANIATAKSSGNYQRAAKNNSYNGKKGNSYDYNLWQAQERLAKAKERLADAKAKAKAEKAKSKSSSGSSSKNSSKSSSSRSYSNYEKKEDVETPEERRVREEAERTREEELRKRKEQNDKVYAFYVESLKRRFKVDEASDVELVKMLPEILAEMQDMRAKRKECSNSVDAQVFRRIANDAKEIGIAAYKRLEKLNKGLFEKPEVQEVIKKIDPDYTKGFFNKIFRFLFDVKYANKKMAKSAGFKNPLSNLFGDDDE